MDRPRARLTLKAHWLPFSELGKLSPVILTAFDIENDLDLDNDLNCDLDLRYAVKCNLAV